MRFLDDENREAELTSLTAAIQSDYCWIFDAKELDFRLHKFSHINENIGSTITFMSNNQSITLPSGWDVLMVSDETYEIDMVPLTASFSFQHTPFLFCLHDTRTSRTNIKFQDMDEKGSVFYPDLPKGSALVIPTHTIGEKKYGIVAGPHDLSRYIDRKTIGELT